VECGNALPLSLAAEPPSFPALLTSDVHGSSCNLEGFIEQFRYRMISSLASRYYY